MCLQPGAWLAKVTQGPIVGQSFRFGANVNLFGFHFSVLSVEFNVYYSVPRCSICGGIQDKWVIQTLCDQPNYSTLDRVKATTFVLLFGVGSFLCYKIFHHLRRSKKSDKSIIIFKEVDAESDISELSVEEACHSSGSFGDGETSTDSISLTDCEDDDDIMGITSSNPLEPVFFNKNSGGIHFKRPCPSPPVDVLGDSPHKQKCSWLEQSNDISLSYDGAASLRGNFSPGSLRERTRRTQEFLENSGDEFFSDSHLPRYNDSEADSIVFYSEKCHPLYRQASVDCEEMGNDLQKKVEAIGRATVEKMEHLDLQLQDLKQSVLELDADIVGLKVYRPPPQRCWELTNISSSSDNGSGIVDVIQHHWTKVWCKGLASPQFQQDEEVWSNATRSILDWDYVFENSADSGSDFGNSFDTDSVEPESSSICCSGVFLEWDHSGLPEEQPVDTTDGKPEVVTRKKKLVTLSKSLSEDTSLRRLTRLHRSLSMPPQMLSQQIKRVIKIPATLAEPSCADDGISRRLMTSQSTGSSGESGFQDVDRIKSERPKQDAKKVFGLNWDSAYCEEMEELTTECISAAVSFSVFQAHIGQDEKHKKVWEHVSSTHPFSHIRNVRNDGYCILRSCLFKCLSMRIPVLGHYGNANTVTDLLTKWSNSQTPWLNKWTFGGKLEYKTHPEGFLDCLSSLQKLENSLSLLENLNDCQEQLVTALNSDPNTDTKVMEALKLLLVITAVKLMEAGHDAPIFYNLLFAQMEPSWPLDRLDRIGNTSMEQADFYLLGYALSTTLKILRPQRFGEADFTCHYPECNLGEWPEIILLSMDDDSWCVIPIT